MRNMKKIIFFFSLLSIFFRAYNQEIEFKEIDNWIKNNPGELVPVRIEFNDNIDCYKLNQQFKDQQTPVDQRAKIVNRLLKEQAIKSQEFVLDFLTDFYIFCVFSICIRERMVCTPNSRNFSMTSTYICDKLIT